MRLRFLFLVISLVISQISHASPVRYYADGVLEAWGTASPYRDGATVSGWYELDWDKAEGPDNAFFGGWLYWGILSYEFVIDNKFHINNANQLSETYYEVPVGDAPVKTDWMRFYTVEPSVDTYGALAIEELHIGIFGGQWRPHVGLSFLSTEDDQGNYYEGRADLNFTHNIRAPEPGTLMLLMLGMAAIFCARFKFCSHR